MSVSIFSNQNFTFRFQLTLPAGSHSFGQYLSARNSMNVPGVPASTHRFLVLTIVAAAQPAWVSRFVAQALGCFTPNSQPALPFSAFRIASSRMKSSPAQLFRPAGRQDGQHITEIRYRDNYRQVDTFTVSWNRRQCYQGFR